MALVGQIGLAKMAQSATVSRVELKNRVALWHEFVN
jgi:hypothetical protein